MTITVRYTSIDRCSKKRTYKTLKAAQKFAHEWVGRHPEIGRGYAVSGDGVGRITVEGATLAELFPPDAPPALTYDEWSASDYHDEQGSRYYDAMPNPTDWMHDPGARFW